VAHAARLSLILFVVALAACGGSGGKTTASKRCPTTGRDVTFPLLDAQRPHTVDVRTNLGRFAFRLDVHDSPCVTSSFASLVRRSFFNGTVFHRIVPGFVIQGGDPTGRGSGGPGYSTVDKPPAGAAYKKGVVAMAKTGSEPAGAAGSQFFVVTGADAGLPPDYAIVGKVTKGLDVVERIGKLGDQSEQPTTTVEIDSFRVSSS
jgi:cyclophilin family peptidyl-prolyl cis-trans isomerase